MNRILFNTLVAGLFLLNVVGVEWVGVLRDHRQLTLLLSAVALYSIYAIRMRYLGWTMDDFREFLQFFTGGAKTKELFLGTRGRKHVREET